MIPQLVERTLNASSSSITTFASRWRIHPALAIRLGFLAAFLPWSVQIISGWRSCTEQAQLEAAGRPAAPCTLSTHTSSIATGADMRIPVSTTDGNKRAFGTAARAAGLRWGGGSPLVNGIPTDWNHVDLGPR